MEDLNKLYKLKKNELLMLQDRGYDVKNELEKYSINFFKKELKTKNFKEIRYDLSSTYKNKELKTVKVIYIGDEKFDKKKIKKIIDSDKKILNDDINVIFITLENISKSMVLEIKNIYGWSLFTDVEIRRRIIDNFYVDIHIKMSDSDKKIFLEKINPDNLPKLGYIPSENTNSNFNIVKDPIVKHYDWQRGDIIEIHRKENNVNRIIKNEIYYRIVQ